MLKSAAQVFTDKQWQIEDEREDGEGIGNVISASGTEE
jgi:hypothetical protein